MPDFDKRTLPFLTRDMLSFGKQDTFTLIVDVVANVSEVLELRGFTESGPFTFKFTPTASSIVQTFRFSIPDVPIGVSLSLTGIGSDTVLAHVVVHLGMSSNRLMLLCQGTINGLFGVAWPIQPPFTNAQLFGAPVASIGTNPAAGQEISDTVPDNEYWEVLGVHVTLATSATVANRTTRLDFQFDQRVFFSAIAGQTMQASETHDIIFLPGGTTQNIITDSMQEVRLPTPFILPAKSSIQSTTTNIQAGDDYAATEYFVRRHYMRKDAS